jgi:N-acetylmuramoyl-L-alanine amidase
MKKKITLSILLLSIISLVVFFALPKKAPVINPPIDDIDKEYDLNPVVPFVIVIDAGHGPFESLDKEPNAPGSTNMKYKSVVGATGNITRVLERDINLTVALQLQALLTNAGYTVVMTRIDNSVNLSNIQRATIANDHHAALMIRIHNDSSTNHENHGASVLVPANVGYAGPIVDISAQYGKIILDTLVSEVGMASRGVKTRSDQTGFNWSKVPVITVEMGFLSNPVEEQNLVNATYQTKLANALFKGIETCFDEYKWYPLIY